VLPDVWEGRAGGAPELLYKSARLISLAGRSFYDPAIRTVPSPNRHLVAVYANEVANIGRPYL
jgi:hypothetical protein